MDDNIYMHGLNYTLGEKTGSYNDLQEFEPIREEFGMSNEPDLWGWGQYYYTEQTYLQQAIATASKTLEETGVAPDEIELVCFCGSTFPFIFEEQNILIGTLFDTLGLTAARPRVFLGLGCATLLSAIEQVCVLMKAWDLHNVLMISQDIVRPGANRFYQYCTLSDAASSLILSLGKSEGYRILGGYNQSNPSLMEGGDDRLLPGQREIYQQVVSSILKKNNLNPEDVNRVFPSNIFLPLQRVYAESSGLKMRQIHTENVATIGHCYSSDPIINLATQKESVQTQEPTGINLLLGAALGHVSGLLVEG